MIRRLIWQIHFGRSYLEIIWYLSIIPQTANAITVLLADVGPVDCRVVGSEPTIPYWMSTDPSSAFHSSSFGRCQPGGRCPVRSDGWCTESSHSIGKKCQNSEKSGNSNGNEKRFFSFFRNPENKFSAFFKTKNAANAADFVLRRDWDSNPGYTFGVHTLSRRAPSTTRTPLRGGCEFGFECGCENFCKDRKNSEIKRSFLL